MKYQGSSSDNFPVQSLPSTAERSRAAPGRLLSPVAEPEKTIPGSAALYREHFAFSSSWTRSRTRCGYGKRNSQAKTLKFLRYKLRAYASECDIGAACFMAWWLSSCGQPAVFSFLILIFRKAKLVGDEKHRKNYNKKKKASAQGFPGNLETCTGTHLSWAAGNLKEHMQQRGGHGQWKTKK